MKIKLNFLAFALFTQDEQLLKYLSEVVILEKKFMLFEEKIVQK